jgi:hypothetical protein
MTATTQLIQATKIADFQITIEDYSLEQGHLFAQVSIPPRKGDANFFNISFDEWDVIEAALSLKLINEPYDHDNGRNGQQMRVGYITAAFPFQQWNKELKAPLYFSCRQIVAAFSGEEEEAIVMHIATKDAQIENVLLETII